MKRASRWHIFLLGISVALLTGCIVVPFGPGKKAELKEVLVVKSEEFFVSDKILVLPIEGLIIGEEESSFFEQKENTVDSIKEKLNKAEEDEDVRGVIFRINSPGGEVTASDIIYREIREFKKRSGKKVVACLMDTATSGAFYVAMGADRIVAHPTTVTGNIGVRMDVLNVEGLMGKIGVRATTLKSGEKKDIGSPLRAMTEEERKILKGVISGLFDRFVEVVAEGRPGLTEREVRKIADGRIYTAEQARRIKLIDQVGYFGDAVDLAKKLAGLKEAHIVFYTRAGDYRGSIYSRLGSAGPCQINLMNIDTKGLIRRRGPVFYYLWIPGGGRTH